MTLKLSPRRLTPLLAAVACLLAHVPPLAAQAPDLVRLVPDDFGLCLIVRDLRGQTERWQKSDWGRALLKTALGKALTEAPELKNLERTRDDLKKALGLDLETLRDEILGDEVLLAYRPGPTDEQGIILLRARDPELLARLVERINEMQVKNGEVKNPTRIAYQGTEYHRRTERGKDQFYFLDGRFLAVAGKDATIRTIIDRHLGKEPVGATWPARLKRARAEQALVSLAINPRILAPELAEQQAKPGLPAGLWRGLDAIFVSVQAGDDLEVRLSVQAKPEAMPSYLRPAFESTPPPSTFWQHVPEQAIATLAARTDFAAAVTALTDVLPDKERRALVDGAQRSLGAATGLDVLKDILPAIGPDWGIAVLPAKQSQSFPPLLTALAVKPNAKNVDQALSRALHFVAVLALIDYNKKHADAIQLQTATQDKVDVKYLVNDKTFPAGFRPAWALKEGFLVIASTPDAILAFRAGAGAEPAHRDEAPLMRISPRGLATMLTTRREAIVRNMAAKQMISRSEADQNLTNLVELLELVDRVALNQRSEAGQASWILRVTPALPRAD